MSTADAFCVTKGRGCQEQVGPIEVYMNAFITPLWVEKPRVSPARELAEERILM
jgi:hypothetical protein